MTALTPIAVANADLLRALQNGHESQAALAAALGISAKNLPRNFAVLEQHGLIHPRAPGAWPQLTEAAAAALRALERAQAEAPEAPGTWTTHARLIPDPANPRKTFDPFELNGLAHNIDAIGLLQPILVRPADPATGLYTIIAGERRWRAIGKLIEWTEDGINESEGWAAHKPIPIALYAGEDRHRRLAALAENLQRRDVPHLEMAEAFDALTQTGMTAEEIAKALGASNRYVQEHLKVFREADPVLKAAHTQGGMTWTVLRDSVKKPTPTPKMTLALVELADAAARFGAARFLGGQTKIRTDVGTGALPDLVRIGFAAETAASEFGLAQAWVTPAGLQWLTDQSLIPTTENRAKILMEVREPVIGAGAAAELARLDSYASRFLAFPKPLPPTGVITAVPGPKAEHHAPASCPAPEPDAIPQAAKRALTLSERAALFELAHKARHAPDSRDTPQGRGAVVCKYWTSATATALAQDLRLIQWRQSPDHPPLGLLTDKGREWLIEQGCEIEADGPPKNLTGPSGGQYETAWLNLDAAPQAAPAPEPEDAADPAEIAAQTTLEDMRAMLRLATRMHDGEHPDPRQRAPSRLDICRLADQIERPLPWSIREHEYGLVFAGNGEVACVCDPNGDLPEDLAKAQSLFIALAANTLGGFRPLRAAEPSPHTSVEDARP